MQLYYALMERAEKTMTQKQLCDELQAPKTSINSIVKDQLKQGYIQLDTNPQNRKEKLISLTEKGQEYANQLILQDGGTKLPPAKAGGSLVLSFLTLRTLCYNK